MQSLSIKSDQLYLVGLTMQTSNANEGNPDTAKIGATVGQYFSQNIAATIPNRKNPGRTIAIYTDYDSDENGPYHYYIGEEVASIEELPEGLAACTIPAGNFQRFTSDAGPMPQIAIQSWQQIWQMSDDQLGGKRNYIADFEVYDERAADPTNTVFDIYIGVE